MSKQRPKDLKSRLDLFSEGLIKHSESELQEFLHEAAQWFSDEPSLEFLCQCKALVDARLRAEPDKKVFSMSDPHEIRLRYLDQIADRLEAEINFRSIVSPQDASGCVADKPFRPGAERQPMVAARRTIVRQNRGLSDKELCELLDRECIHLPKGWLEAGFKTWVDAYRNPMKLKQIHVIFSKDRKLR